MSEITLSPKLPSYYAIRAGEQKGIYQTWGEAVSAKWHKHQGYGNAVKFTDEVRANTFMSQTPFPERDNESNTLVILPVKPKYKWHFITQILVFSLLMTALFCSSFYALIYLRTYFDCDHVSSMFISGFVCIPAERSIIFVRENQLLLTNYIMSLVALFFTWLVKNAFNLIQNPSSDQ